MSGRQPRPLLKRVIATLRRAGALTGAGVLVPELPAAVRARIELLRERAADGGMEVTCGGVSMEPVIARGATVRVTAGSARRGAVAVFVTATGVLEMHRLVARAGDWWAHVGDNQTAPDVGLVHRSQLVGIADVPAVAPSAAVTARALARFGQAAIRVGWAAVTRGRSRGSRRRR